MSPAELTDQPWKELCLALCIGCLLVALAARGSEYGMAPARSAPILGIKFIPQLN